MEDENMNDKHDYIQNGELEFRYHALQIMKIDLDLYIEKVYGVPGVNCKRDQHNEVIFSIKHHLQVLLEEFEKNPRKVTLWQEGYFEQELKRRHFEHQEKLRRSSHNSVFAKFKNFLFKKK
jgi:hypothetical protein